ncbi:MAG: RNA polymerase sigma factor [Actinomycetota bacterium]|nr:RNA polymerase sigma factor [Actinomycetota bacterium]
MEELSTGVHGRAGASRCLALRPSEGCLNVSQPAEPQGFARRRFRPSAGATPTDQRSLERQAIAQAKRGDWDGLHYLYVCYADEVLAYVRGIVRDHHEAEDITQDIFSKLMSKIQRYEERSVPFAAWITRVARNATLDHLRARNRQVPVEEVRVSEAGEERRHLERRQCLMEALASLPEEQRKVIMMRHVAGLSPGEIATRLGKTESSVQGLHHRGRVTLRTALTECGFAPLTASQQL